MPTAITVVDDSSLSRKMLIKALPVNWQVEITQVSSGREALDAYHAGKADVMFLDLTMPEMNGFQVLEILQQEGVKACIIVVSADIQPEAQQRVKQLGAVAFVKKPVKTEQIEAVLQECGIL
jgi:CheY-like chemotaxis protein